MANYDPKFVAALALFSSIYDEKEQDSYGIIQEFIKACVKTKNIEHFNINDIKGWLFDSYCIDLPQPVIKKALTRISDNDISYNGKEYLCHVSQIYDIQGKIGLECSKFDNILQYIYSAISVDTKSNITAQEKEDIKNCFFDFLVGDDNNNSNKFYAQVARIIIANDYKDLSSVKEGLVVYNGLKFAKEVDNNTWKNPIVIFLDTEYLFDAVGLNGEVSKEIFKEFFDLVQSVNKASFKRYGENNRISLCFFHEIKTEIDSYFGQAERIKNGRDFLRGAENAMKIIISSCNDSCNVLEYKAKLISSLNRNYGIKEYSEISQTEIPNEFLIEEESLIKKLDNNVMTKEGEKKDISYYVKLCDYVNYLRKGQNNRCLEDIKYIFVSRKRVALGVSRIILNSISNAKIPFISNLDFLTEKLWYKLKRPFINSDTNLFDIIIRSKIVLASLLQKSILPEYERINNELKSGNLTLDGAKEYYNELRSRNTPPEDITRDNVDSCLAFINSNDNLAGYQQTQNILKNKAILLEKFQKDNKALLDDNEKLSKEKKQLNYDLCQKDKMIEKFAKEKQKAFVRRGVRKSVWYTGGYIFFIVVLICLNLCCKWIEGTWNYIISSVLLLLSMIVPSFFNNCPVFKCLKIKELKRELGLKYDSIEKNN